MSFAHIIWFVPTIQVCRSNCNKTCKSCAYVDIHYEGYFVIAQAPFRNSIRYEFHTCTCSSKTLPPVDILYALLRCCLCFIAIMCVLSRIARVSFAYIVRAIRHTCFLSPHNSLGFRPSLFVLKYYVIVCQYSILYYHHFSRCSVLLATWRQKWF